MLVYRLAPEHFLLVVNAANIEKDYAWISEQIARLGDVVAVNASSRYALLALQGPAAREVLQPLTGVDLAGMKYYWFAHGEVANVRATISRTGYTGEDGFEMFVAAAGRRSRVAGDPERRAGSRTSCRPAWARATHSGWKRRCACTATTSTTRRRRSRPDLGWIVGWKKDDFTGAAALREQKAGVSRASWLALKWSNAASPVPDMTSGSRQARSARSRAEHKRHS